MILLNSGHKILYGTDILTHLKPKQDYVINKSNPMPNLPLNSVELRTMSGPSANLEPSEAGRQSRDRFLLRHGSLRFLSRPCPEQFSPCSISLDLT